MRIPDSILARVRGTIAAAALVGCSSPTPAAPDPAPPPSTIVATPAPIDPVAYASADEDTRLSRIDAESIATLDVREARIGHLAERRRRETLSAVDIRNALGNLYSPGDPQFPGGPGTIDDPGIGRWGGGCAGCGRG